MKKKRSFLNKNYNIILKFISIPLIIGLVISVIPNNYRQIYNYEIGKTWDYPDLNAAFDFPIKKTQTQQQQDIENIKSTSLSYYKLDKELTKQHIANINIRLQEAKLDLDSTKTKFIINVFSEIQNKGIIASENTFQNKKTLNKIKLISGNTISYIYTKDIYTISDAEILFKEKLNSANIKLTDIIFENLSPLFTENIKFDRQKTEQAIQNKINKLSSSYGVVHKGELIISNGEIIGKEKALLLESLNDAYTYHSKVTTLSKVSDFILSTIIIFVFLAFILAYRPKIIKRNKSFVLIMSFLVGAIISFAFTPPQNVYIIPILIFPIILRSFFDHKIAFGGLILISLLSSLNVPYGLEFITVTITTGIILLANMQRLEKRSQYFITSIIAFIFYCAIYFLMLLTQTSEISFLSNHQILCFFINSGLLILSFPLILLIEKLFGYTTDITLIELSNTNNKLLRKLSNAAPGTFQHSIQVANLAESAAAKIGADALLVRVGALYHDIGKIDEPYYFTENQVKNINPHESLLPEQSANMLLNHVNHGIEVASKYHIPEDVKDFIRTHHGTREISFFYRIAVEQYGIENIKKEDFQYKGPRPFNKETAIVMMADSIEAASKSLNEADEQRLTLLVNNIIDKQITEGQFNNSNISLKEIEEVKKIFIDKLKSIYHLRIKYPD